MMQMQISGAPRTMSSREIAELTEKNHADVLRDIRNMLEQLGERESSFAGTYQVPGPNGATRSAPCFDLPEDLTITLVSGYSVQMRHRIVKRWQELEAGAAQASGPSTRSGGRSEQRQRMKKPAKCGFFCAHFLRINRLTQHFNMLYS